MNSVPHRLLNRRDLGRESTVGYPGILLGNRHVFREGTRAIDADDLDASAYVLKAVPALVASIADDVALRRDVVAHSNVLDVLAGCHHFPAELVAEHHWGVEAALGPGIPEVDVQVGAADGGGEHPDQHVLRPDFWNRNLAQLRARRRSGLYQCLHRRRRHPVSDRACSVRRDLNRGLLHAHYPATARAGSTWWSGRPSTSLYEAYPEPAKTPARRPATSRPPGACIQTLSTPAAS